MSKFIGDDQGSSLVEFTLVFPILMLVALGTVDVTYMLYEWALANKAAYRGARVAIVSDPVSRGITNLTYNSADIGQACFDLATGLPTNPAKCPTVNVTCELPIDTQACPGFDNAAFTDIVQAMQQIFPRLQPGHVRIQYVTTGLGFAGRPDGLPMEVTVSIKCMTHQFFFLAGLMGWAYSAPASPCPSGPAGPPMPAFLTTLTSEDMVTN